MAEWSSHVLSHIHILISTVCLICWNAINSVMDCSMRACVQLQNESHQQVLPRQLKIVAITQQACCVVLTGQPRVLLSWRHTEQRINTSLSLPLTSCSRSYFVCEVFEDGTAVLPVKTKLLCDFTLTCFRLLSQLWETAATQQTTAEFFFNAFTTETRSLALWMQVTHTSGHKIIHKT